MLATPTPRAGALPQGPEWVYEVKWDGVRVLADTRGGSLRLVARSGRDVTVTYPDLAGLAALPDALVDGEVVVMAGGIPSFEALAERMNVRDPQRAARLAARVPATYMAFDVLVLDGVDVSRRPLEERRALLEQVVVRDGAAPPERLLLSPVYDDGETLWEVTREHGLEGVVAKRRTSTYQPGRRSPDWVKAPHRATRTAAVVGWRTEGYGRTGSPAMSSRLGAVLLGAPDGDGRWRYLGKAGSGLAGRRGAELLRALDGLDRADAPLDDDVPREDARGVQWCEPRVAVEVRYLQRMGGGRLRQPVVLAMRTDADVDPWELT